MTISLRKLRSLSLLTPAEEERPSFVAAASGAVHHAGHLYVIADDEQSLACFSDVGTDSRWIRLLAGDLPLDPELRKAVKGDFETLTLLPRCGVAPEGGLLALGSGSHLRRRWGALLRFDGSRRPVEPATRVDLQALYAALRQSVTQLNIEGAVVLGRELVLLQRGTKGAGNALITLDLAKVLASLETGSAIDPGSVGRIIPVELPPIGDSPCGFTDGIELEGDRILFTAAAERTHDPYLDGKCDGSILGVVGLDGRVTGFDCVEPPVKLEGLTRVGDRLWLVTDQDDPGTPATLFEADLPRFAVWTTR